VYKKIPEMSSKKFVRLLEKGGAIFVRQRGISHAIFERVKERKIYRASVVMNKKALSKIHQVSFSLARFF